VRERLGKKVPVADIGVVENKEQTIKDLRSKMQLAAQNLEFERAAQLRDLIAKLRA